MHFFTDDQCASWMRGRPLPAPDGGWNEHVKLAFPTEPYRVFVVARALVHAIGLEQPMLLRTTQSGIWPTSENLHLYYTLRRSYGDQRLLEDAPGHLFQGYETADGATFLQVALLNGWDGYLASDAGYSGLAFTHDDRLTVYATDATALKDILDAVPDANR